jgi:DNA-binding GntR family transcriptional regulator
LREPCATKSDYAYLTLRERILGGGYGSGAVLHQTLLAKTIGISTAPLREALRLGSGRQATTPA